MLSNIKFISKQKSISIPTYTIDYLPEALELFEDVVGVDTETTGYDAHGDRLLSLQIGDFNNQIVIDSSHYPLKELVDVLNEYFKDKVVILQNAQFDLRFFYKYGIDIPKLYDTLLAECIITGGLGNKEDIKNVKELLGKETAVKYVDRHLGLDKLALKYCNIELDKSIRGIIHREGMSERVIKYGADDVKYLPEIRNKQLEILNTYEEKYGIGLEVLELENEAVKVFSRMAFNGIKVDSSKYKKEVIAVADKEVKRTINELDAEVHKSPKLKKYAVYQGNLFFQTRKTEINWNSSTQKLKILNELGEKVKDTNANTIRKEVKHPIGKKLLEYNEYKKLENAFGEEFLKNINKETLRMHPSIWQILSTGRISMSDPNLLQIPARGHLGDTIRKCFIPEKGNKIVGGDYSGFELRIIAEFSQDPLWVNTFKEDGDLHSILCSETFDIPVTDVKKPFPYNTNITYRDVQKTLNFGLSYGMSEFKLSNTIGVSKAEAKQIIDKFFSKVPEVKKFLDKLGNLGKNRGYIKVPNPYGRIRFFPKFDVIKDYPYETKDISFRWYGEMERASKNTPIQGLNGTVIKRALIRTQQEIDNNKYPAKILLSVYDEIQTECEESFAEEWKNILQNCMIAAGEEIIKTVPVKADCAIGDYWIK